MTKPVTKISVSPSSSLFSCSNSCSAAVFLAWYWRPASLVGDSALALLIDGLTINLGCWGMLSAPKVLRLSALVAEGVAANWTLEMRVDSVSFGFATVWVLAISRLSFGAFLMDEVASVLLGVLMRFTVVAYTCGNSNIVHKSTKKTWHRHLAG